MSIATWIGEFYPVNAQDCPKEDALEHSILKWKGALPEALEKHGLDLREGVLLAPDGKFYFDVYSCALCYHYMRPLENELPCKGCPANSCHNIYRKFKNSNDPILS